MVTDVTIAIETNHTQNFHLIPFSPKSIVLLLSLHANHLCIAPSLPFLGFAYICVYTPIELQEVALVSIVKSKFTSNNSGSAFLIIDHMKMPDDLTRY